MARRLLSSRVPENPYSFETDTHVAPAIRWRSARSVEKSAKGESIDGHFTQPHGPAMHLISLTVGPCERGWEDQGIVLARRKPLKTYRTDGAHLSRSAERT
jgi:hypothetical protein